MEEVDQVDHLEVEQVDQVEHLEVEQVEHLEVEHVEVEQVLAGSSQTQPPPSPQPSLPYLSFSFPPPPTTPSLLSKLNTIIIVHYLFRLKLCIQTEIIHIFTSKLST